MNSFLSELKRRNVFKVTAAYAAVAWILISVGDIFFPMLGAPDWAMKVFVLIAIVGLPIAFIFAWAFELTPEGLKRTVEVAVGESITPQTGKRLNVIVIGLLVAALSVSVFLNLRQDTRSDVVVPRTAQSSVAVLPFTSRSTDPDNQLFADGIHDDLLTTLANIGSLKVISRTSVMEYRDTKKNMRQIGNELGVNTLLEGAVQRSGDNVRINVQLIDAQTDDHLWAKTYDEELTAQNIFQIQSKISNAIADALKTTLTPEEKNRLAVEPTENLEAYTLFMAGKAKLYERGLDNIIQARELFEKAIAIDPKYARAHAGLAAAISLQFSNHFALPRAESVRLSSASINTALSLDSEDAGIYAVLGLIKRNESEDNRFKPGFAEAEVAFRRAIELNPNHVQALMWYAGMLSPDGQFEAAASLYERAMDLDPLARVPRQNMMVLLARIGKGHEGIDLALDTIELFPDYAPSYHFIADHLVGLGRLDEAMAWSKEAISRDSDPLAFGRSVPILQEFSQLDQLAALVEGMPENHPLFHVVQAFAVYGQGDVQGALDRIEGILSVMDDPPVFFQGMAANFALELGDCKKALRHMGQISSELFEEQPTILNQNFRVAVAIAHCLQKDNQNDRAELLLNGALAFIKDSPRLGATGFGILDAEIYALLGQPDRAMSVLRDAVDQGFRSSLFYSIWKLEDNIFLNSIKGDPEFASLVEIVNADILRMRGNVELAEKNEDWGPLRSLVKNGETLVN